MTTNGWRAISAFVVKGVGDLLPADAAPRVLAAARPLAVFAIVVDAKTEIAAAFCRDFGFTPFPNRPQKLFMPNADASEAMSRALPE